MVFCVRTVREEVRSNIAIFPKTDTSQVPLTTSRRHHLIQQLHACPLPDFLDDSSQLLICLLQITCTTGKLVSLREHRPRRVQTGFITAGNVGYMHQQSGAVVFYQQDREAYTFSFNLEGRAHQCKQRGIEHDGAVTV